MVKKKSASEKKATKKAPANTKSAKKNYVKKKKTANKKKRPNSGSFTSYMQQLKKTIEQDAKELREKEPKRKSKVAVSRTAKIRKVSPKKIFEMCKAVRLADHHDYDREQAAHYGATPAGLTPMWYAVRWQMPFAVETFLSFGVPISVNFPGRPSLLDLARSHSSAKIANMLEEAGAEPKPPTQLDQEQADGHPNWPTFLYVTEKELPLIEAIKAGDIARIGELAKTLGRECVELIYTEAAIEGDLEVVQALFPHIDYREEIGQFTTSGYALEESVQRGHLEIAKWLIEVLLEMGVEKKEFGYLVDAAAKTGQEEPLDYLLECGFTPMTGYQFGEIWQKYDREHTFTAIVNARYARILTKMIPFLPEQKQERYLKKMEKVVAKKGEQTIPLWYSGEAEDV